MCASKKEESLLLTSLLEITTQPGQRLHADRLRARFPGKEVRGHVLENCWVCVVLRFLRSVDANRRFELGGLAAHGGAHDDLASGGKFLDRFANAGDLDHFVAR